MLLQEIGPKGLEECRRQLGKRDVSQTSVECTAWNALCNLAQGPAAQTGGFFLSIQTL